MEIKLFAQVTCNPCLRGPRKIANTLESICSKANTNLKMAAIWFRKDRPRDLKLYDLLERLPHW